MLIALDIGNNHITIGGFGGAYPLCCRDCNQPKTDGGGICVPHAKCPGTLSRRPDTHYRCCNLFGCAGHGRYPASSSKLFDRWLDFRGWGWCKNRTQYQNCRAAYTGNRPRSDRGLCQPYLSHALCDCGPWNCDDVYRAGQNRCAGWLCHCGRGTLVAVCA